MNKKLKIEIFGASGQHGKKYFHLFERYNVVTLVDFVFKKPPSSYSEKSNCRLFYNIEEAIQPVQFLGVHFIGNASKQKKIIYISKSLILFKEKCYATRTASN